MSYIRRNIAEEQDIINSYVNLGNQEFVSKKHNITRRHLKELLKLNNIPIRAQSQSLKGKQNGELNPNWKGGAADEHMRIEFGGAWKRALTLWSELVKHADKHICPQCGKDGQDAHHIISIREIFRNGLDKNLIFAISNGIYLCKSCHMKTHMNEEKFRDTFQKLIIHRLNSVELLQEIMTVAVRKYRAKWKAKCLLKA